MDIPLRTPKIFYRGGYTIRRFPIVGGLNMFVFKDEDGDCTPRESFLTAASIVVGIVKSGPFGNQSNAKLAAVLHDMPNWEVFVVLDKKAFVDERLKRKRLLAKAIADMEGGAKVLKTIPSVSLDNVLPNFRGLNYVKADKPRIVSSDKIVGHVCNDFDNWMPSEKGKLICAMSEVIGGTSYWEKPIECLKIGGVYWVFRGCTKIAAMKLLGISNVRGVYVSRYRPVGKKFKQMFPRRTYKRQ